jgi:6-pyruvoyltetrahydropterin/6-carboxytetrahydropterin synthase
MLGWLDDHWDHAFILFADDASALAAVRAARPTKYFVLPWNPTAENMARYLLEVVAPRVLGDLGVVARRVALWETDEACAVATRERPVSPPVPLGSAVIVDDRG